MSIIFSARLWRSIAPTPRAISGASTFSSTVSQGNSAKLWKTMDDVGNLAVHHLAVPQHVTRRRLRQPGQHAQQRGFARARRPQQADNLPRRHLEVGRRNHLNAIAVRLRIVFFDRAGLNDGLGQRLLSSSLRFIQSRGSCG